MARLGAIEEAVREILLGIGEDPQREGLKGTPQRVAEMYRELFSGLARDPLEELTVEYAEGQGDAVILRDVPFYSMCEHHLLPFFGLAHIGYLPNGRIAGLSKIVRALEVLARRPQLQERLTSQIADTLFQGLTPTALAVVLKAQHLCLSMRGVEKPGSVVVTCASRGKVQGGWPGAEPLLALLRGA